MSPQTNLVSVPINLLISEPYIRVLCYPSSDRIEAKRRVAELGRLGVKFVTFQGRTKIGGLSLLGKGCVSLAVKTEIDGQLFALKIRRTDANRPSMYREAGLHCFANEVGIGPRLYAVSNNFLLMDLVEGEDITNWVRGLKGLGSTARLRNVLNEIFNQSFKLDQAGIDHGELSNLEKHVFIGKKVVIIDFETASLKRKVSNVTSAVQNLLVGGPNAKKVRRMLRLNGIQSIIEPVRYYKEAPRIKRFKAMLREFKLL